MFRVPQGFTDLLPERAEVFYFVKERLLSLFKSYGFLPVNPVSVEFITTFTAAGEDEVSTFNFIDHVDGKTACFRQDFTPQIARIVATHNLTLPAKLCYEGVVLRNPKELTGERREIFQAGVEIIGVESLTADIELVVIADGVFKEVGVSEQKIFINDVSLIKSIFGEGNYIPSELRSAFIVKDISEIRKIVSKSGLSAEKRDFLCELPLFCGDTRMLEEIERRFRVDEIKPSLKRLKSIAQNVNKLGIEVLFDLGELRGFEYHSSIILDCYGADKKGQYHEIITGGRYDNMLVNYMKKNVAATGLGVDILKLSYCANHNKEISILLLCDGAEQFGQGLKLAKMLRQRGKTVFLANVSDLSEQFAEEEKGFDFKILLEKNRCILRDMKKGREEVVKKITVDFINKFLQPVLK